MAKKIAWDSVNKGTNITLTNEDLTASNIKLGFSTKATEGRTSGKWYWELSIDKDDHSVVGVASKEAPLNGNIYNDVKYFRGYRSSTGNKYPGDTFYGSVYKSLDVIGIALDLDIGTLGFYVNGVFQGVSHTNIKLLGEVYPVVTGVNNNATVTANFGALPFKYLMPVGFIPYDLNSSYSWNSTNKILISSNDKPYSVQKESIVSAIPVMTSNTLPNGIASASSIFDSSDAYNPYRAFNSLLDNDGWVSASTNITGWLSYEFVKPKRIVKYSLLPRTATLTASPRDWTFEGWDGVEWVILDTQINQTNWVDKVYKEYSFINKNSYIKYRINVTKNDGNASYISITDFKMFEIVSVSKTISIPSTSEQNFISHGMDTPFELDTAMEVGTRAFVEQTPTVLGSGKVFKKSIDTAKIVIKSVSIE